jgi:predicted phosphodiesterase
VRIAVLSDIHGNIRGLDACLADLAAQGGADIVVAAGDLCMDGARPKRVLKRLRDIGALAVRGNTDRMIAEGPLDEDGEIAWYREALGPDWQAWLGALPFALRLGDPAAPLVVTHANPKSDEEHVWPDADDAQLERLFGGDAAPAFAFGHLHVPYVRMWRGKLLVNVASAGLPKDGDPRVHYAIFTERPGGWQVKSRRVDFDIARAERDLEKSDHPHRGVRIAVLRRHRYKQIGPLIP